MPRPLSLSALIHPKAVCNDIGPLLLTASCASVWRVPKLRALCLTANIAGWSNCTDYRSNAWKGYSQKSARGFREGGIMLLAGQTHRTRRPMNSKEAHPVTEDTPPTNNGVPDETPARQDVDVLLDVSELEVDRIKLTVRDLRAHVSVLAELAGLVSLQVGVDARLDEVELEIEGVRAKLLLKVRLDNVRAILKHALDTVAEHPEILRTLTRALDELLTGRLGDALGTVE